MTTKPSDLAPSYQRAATSLNNARNALVTALDDAEHAAFLASIDDNADLQAAWLDKAATLRTALETLG